jgi:CRISPR-associated endonuclease/helicase Cas3
MVCEAILLRGVGKWRSVLMKIRAIAHVKQNESGEWKVHDLEEHLVEVAKLASEFAKDFGASDWAFLAGIWHDLGKYRPAFQNYIRSVSGYDPDAHIEQGKGRVDHSTAGAIYSTQQLGEYGKILAYLIAGHHAGLADWNTVEAGSSSLFIRLEEGKKKNYLDESLSNNIPQEILNFKMPITKILGGSKGLHLWLRILFSCLVDADFLDTEKFMSPEKMKDRTNWLDLSSLKNKFDDYMSNKIKKAPSNKVNDLRAVVLENCRESGISKNPGIFSLTVPTGGGKTLASMAFALEHAIKYGKKRIIIAIPYTSIIEQTADQYRKIFGDEIIEHHSNLDFNKETLKTRLASENWDAPIIITTNVQLLESLFSVKTSRCRKLHHLVNSVIIFDEAQLLPPDFLQPVVNVLNLLTQYYGVTLLLSTATQPALNSRKNAFGQIKFHGLDNVTEIIHDVPKLYNALRRVDIELPDDLEKRLEWETVANELTQYPSVLAIVNTRKDCRILFDLMPKGTIQLSGLMCGQHRSEVIADIKSQLEAGKSVRVISTQLVEAGVDLDFPVVYRALTGLDSIAQAAGRCNREGKLLIGKCVVFVPPKAPPIGMLKQAEQATRNVLHHYEGELFSLKHYRDYFSHYFNNLELDKHDIMTYLTKDAGHGNVQFRSVAERFKIIDDKGTHQILIPYNEEAEKLLSILKNSEPERYLMRRLQRYSVTVYEQDFRKLRDIGAIEEVKLGIWAVCVTNAYDERGLLMTDDLYSSEASTLII